MMQHYHSPNTWRWDGWKKPIWRRIRDFFDDTEGPRSKKLHQKISTISSNQVLIQEKYPCTLEQALPQERYPFDIIDIPVTISIPRFKFNISTRDVAIPIRPLSISFKKKPISINLPKIKIQFLKKLALISILIALPSFLIISLFVAWRLVSLTDGDFLGKTYLYKVDKFMESRVIPVEATVGELKEKIKELEIREETRSYKDRMNYKPIIKKYNIYDTKGNLIKSETRN